MAERSNPYHGHRFPREVIAHAVRLYLRFALSFPDVEELLAERGVQVSYEAIACGAARSDRSWSRGCAATGAVQLASGTWTRCS